MGNHYIHMSSSYLHSWVPTSTNHTTISGTAKQKHMHMFIHNK